MGYTVMTLTNEGNKSYNYYACGLLVNVVTKDKGGYTNQGLYYLHCGGTTFNHFMQWLGRDGGGGYRV